MTREIIEGAKEVFIPYITGELIHYNVGGNGEAHAKQARKDLEEIFGLAIKALEQEPTTKNDLGVEDCVSRAEVLKLMKDNWHTHNGDWAMQESMDDIRALPSVTPQESFKPMVEIDLYSVIKQKYIEREVLDKIRAEIVHLHDWAFDRDGVLKIIDKYKAESEI